MADRLANQPGCEYCGCGPCDEFTSCFALLVCAEYVPALAMTIAGAELDRDPTGESETGATGAAGEAFCHTWTSRPDLSRVEFAWKDCNLAAYLPTVECDYRFDFDVCIARGVLWDAYDILDSARVDDVQVCADGTFGAIPWTDSGSTPCVVAGTTREVYWWNVPASYAASGLDCTWTYTGIFPSTGARQVSISTDGFLVGTSPAEYAPYIWECTRIEPWCCEDDAIFDVGGLPVDDPDGLWSFSPCHSGAWLYDAPAAPGWGCPGCRAAADMTYANMAGWALNVSYDFSFTYYYPDGFLLPPASHSVSLTGTMAFNCDSGIAAAPSWADGPISVSWPAGYYYFAYETPGIDPPHPYNVTSIRILFYINSVTGTGYLVIQALANDIPPGGFSFDACDRGGRDPIGWGFEPDTADGAFVQMTEGAPYGQCDHHIDWSGTATEPYSPTTCRLYGTVSVTGPV